MKEKGSKKGRFRNQGKISPFSRQLLPQWTVFCLRDFVAHAQGSLACACARRRTQGVVGGGGGGGVEEAGDCNKNAKTRIEMS